MRVGIGLANGGSNVDAGEVVRIAVEAERLGLDSVWVMDRWLRPHAPVRIPGVPVPVEMPAESYASVLDPLEILTFIAARTERIELGTSAINVLYHPPVLLARRLATLDRLSGGRLLAGVASGWMAEEFGVAGVPKTHMGEGFDDHVAAMRRVWGPDPVNYEGSHYAIPTSDIGPKPLRNGGVPLLVGFATAAGIRRAARVGDGVHPYQVGNDLRRLTDDLSMWRQRVRAAGRDPEAMPVVLRAEGILDAPEAGKYFTGGVHDWIDDLGRLQELGVTHVFAQFGTDVGVDRALETLARLADAAHG